MILEEQTRKPLEREKYRATATQQPEVIPCFRELKRE